LEKIASGTTAAGGSLVVLGSGQLDEPHAHQNEDECYKKTHVQYYEGEEFLAGFYPVCFLLIKLCRCLNAI